MKIFKIVVGFFGFIISILGVFGIKSLFQNATKEKKQKKMVKKVQDGFKKIDESVDTRSDIDVLRKQ